MSAKIQGWRIERPSRGEHGPFVLDVAHWEGGLVQRPAGMASVATDDDKNLLEFDTVDEAAAYVRSAFERGDHYRFRILPRSALDLMAIQGEANDGTA